MAAAQQPEKKLQQEINTALRTLQSDLVREGLASSGGEREIVEHYKLLTRYLDSAVEKTRKRQEPREDDEWRRKKERLTDSQKKILRIFNIKQ